MPRSARDKDGTRATGGRHHFAFDVDPFSVGNEVERCDSWDSRTEELAAVVLGFLARGQAVMFGVSRDGSVVSVGVNVGEKQWSRKTVRDEGEWIGVIHELALWLREQKAKEAATE